MSLRWLYNQLTMLPLAQDINLKLKKGMWCLTLTSIAVEKLTVTEEQFQGAIIAKCGPKMQAFPQTVSLMLVFLV